MKISNETNINDEFVCEFYATIVDGIVELQEGVELSSSSSTEILVLSSSSGSIGSSGSSLSSSSPSSE